MAKPVPQSSSQSISVPPPFTLVIFGASGDLTRRKLIPALYQLFRQHLLPENIHVIAFARRAETDETFRSQLQQAMDEHASGDVMDRDRRPQFARCIEYLQSDFGDPAGFEELHRRLEQIGRAEGTAGNVLYYLATSPDNFGVLVEQLQRANLVHPQGDSEPWARLIVEKPFGRDLDSARQLNRRIKQVFREDQIYRIDHYLGKETVQNLLVLRFANCIFEPLWNNRHIDHVQITVAESLGIEGRGGYYDQAGALRDMVQNHIMHLLTLAAMEAPPSLSAEHIRDEKVKILKSLRPISPECVLNQVVRGQYAGGTYRGQPVAGYRDEGRVGSASVTETFVAFKAFIDNDRWRGVPFYLRTGKRLAARITDIGVHFKSPHRSLFAAGSFGGPSCNVLAIRIQPQEGIRLRFQVKVPGPAMKIEPLQMDFNYDETFCTTPPDAYQRLLLDAAWGDSTLFTRDDEVEAAWSFVEPILEGCSRESVERLCFYPAGSWGPEEADRLIEADHRQWDILKKFVSPCPVSFDDR